jgi:hypothetical protein
VITASLEMKKHEGGRPYDTILPPTGIYPYLFTEKTPMRDDVIGIMETRPALRERRSVADRVIEKIKTFVQTFIEGVD